MVSPEDLRGALEDLRKLQETAIPVRRVREKMLAGAIRVLEQLTKEPMTTHTMTIQAAKFVLGPKLTPLVGSCEDYFTIGHLDPVATFSVAIQGWGEPLPPVGSQIAIPMREPVGSLRMTVERVENGGLFGSVRIYNREQADAVQTYLDGLKDQATKESK